MALINTMTRQVASEVKICVHINHSLTNEDLGLFGASLKTPVPQKEEDAERKHERGTGRGALFQQKLWKLILLYSSGDFHVDFLRLL